MTAVVIIESIALLAAAWHLWRRARARTLRRGAAFALFVLALLLHAAVTLLSESVLDGIHDDRGFTTAAIALVPLQVVRACLLGWAAYFWLQVPRARLVRSWRGWMILVCLLFITFIPDSTVGFGLIMLIPLARVRWTRDVHGWGRLGMVIALALLTFALLTTTFVTLPAGDGGRLVTEFGGGGAITDLEGEVADAVSAAVKIAWPWEHAMRVLLVLLRLQLLVSFFQLLVVPIRLRGLSIKRRFTVTLAMYRFIPGTLAFIFMVLIAYLGIGLHRAGVVRNTFDDTLERAMQSVDTIIENPPARGTLRRPDTVRPEDDAFALVRDLEWTEVENDTVDFEGWTGRARAWSRNTPPALVESNAFADATADSAVGIVSAGGGVYLRAARIHRDGDNRRGVGAEVFVEVDSTYLARIAGDVQSDIRLDVSPRLFIGESTVSIVGNEESGWTDSTFTVEARTPRVAGEDTTGGLWNHRLYLARTFLPVGNWLEAPGGSDPIGAIQLKLHTTPRILWRSLTGNTFMLTSQAFALVILALIALLFIIVELSAVRTGRSIVRGIVDDVKTLTLAARRFGEGDLTRRVELSGTDEMGQLAATFNDMAANIAQHQEVLREKERLEADLSLARDIQQRMLPQSPPVIPGLDVAGLSIPSREVGGDLFYFLPVSGGRLGLTIGDVSGKSVPAALLMSNVLAALKSEARIVDAEDEILTHLNRLIVEQVEPGRFVTFFYGVVSPRERMLRYACAGHNPPLVMRTNGEAEWLEEAGVPLGVVAESVYVPVEVALEPGDVLVLYSDGVTEAQRTDDNENAGEDDNVPPADEFFDEGRLEAAVRAARARPATEIISHVMDAVRDFTRGAEQSDDLTLVVVRMAPGAGEAAIR